MCCCGVCILTQIRGKGKKKAYLGGPILNVSPDREPGSQIFSWWRLSVAVPALSIHHPCHWRGPWSLGGGGGWPPFREWASSTPGPSPVSYSTDRSPHRPLPPSWARAALPLLLFWLARWWNTLPRALETLHFFTWLP